MSDFERSDKLVGPALYKQSDHGATRVGQAIILTIVLLGIIAIAFG